MCEMCDYPRPRSVAEAEAATADVLRRHRGELRELFSRMTDPAGRP
jgi:hypothetical protein